MGLMTTAKTLNKVLLKNLVVLRQRIYSFGLIGVHRRLPVNAMLEELDEEALVQILTNQKMQRQSNTRLLKWMELN